MKAKNYLFLLVFLIFGIFTSYAQCGVSVGKDTTIVCGSLVQLDALPLTAPDSISWSPALGLSDTAISNPIAKPLITTMYVVTTYTGVCIARDSIIITVDPLTADAGADKNLICGGSVKLDSVISNYKGNTSLTYSWSPSTGLSNAAIANPVATVTQPTKYYVTVTTSNGCSAIDSVTVSVNPFIADAGINKVLNCGNSITLDSVTSNYTGSGMLTYSWSPGGSLNNSSIANPIATVIETTKYKVVVETPNGCKSTDSVLVMVNPILVEAGTDKTIVCGSAAKLDSAITNYNGPGPLTFSWLPTTGLDNASIPNPAATVKQTTKYYVTITTPGGCVGTDSVMVIVDSLKAEAGNNKTFVCGGSIQLDNVTTNNTSPGVLTYSWSPGGGLSSTSIPNPIASFTSTRTYYVTVTNQAGCSAKDSVIAIVAPFTVDAGGDKIVSCGNTVQLDYVNSNYSGTGSLTYSWFPSTGLNNPTIPNPSVTIKQQTTYVVTVNTPNGCIDTDTVTVYVGPLTVDAGNDRNIVCGEGIQLNTTTSYTGTGATYAWTPSTGLSLSNIANPVASPLQTTTFYVKVTTPSGCTATDSIKITAHLFEADAGADKTLVCGGEAQLQVTTNYSGIGSLSYAWKPSAGLNLSNIANPKASVSSPTAFSVVVTTPNGCKAYDTVNVLVGTLKADAGPNKTITCGGKGQLEVTTNYTGNGTLSYLWTPSSGLNFSNIYNPIVNVAQTTTFIVKAQSGNGCIAYDTIDVIVNPLTVNVGLDKLLSCGKSIQLDSALTNYDGSGTLTYSWSPKTGLNNSSIANPVTTKGGLTYTLSVFTPFGACKAVDQVKVDYIPLVGTDICIVAWDTTNKNIVVWPKAIEGAIDSFLVYKETAVAGTYAKIGSVSQKAATQFKDVTSQPDIKPGKYKLSMKDTCGVETALSDPHKTMFLTVTKGATNEVILKWNKYEGVNVSSYIIYRGTSKTNLQFIGSTAGANDEYTDSGAPAGTVYYQVEFTNLAACNSTNLIKSSRSNIVSNSPIGIYEYENNFSFTIYPNPTSEMLTVNVDQVSTKNMTLNIYNSLGALVRTQGMERNSQQFNVSDLKNGFYIVELRTSNGSSKQKLTIQR
jgi:hypothetical protein